MIAATAELLVV